MNKCSHYRDVVAWRHQSAASPALDLGEKLPDRLSVGVRLVHHGAVAGALDYFEACVREPTCHITGRLDAHLVMVADRDESR
jgi:hypothetical protein